MLLYKKAEDFSLIICCKSLRSVFLQVFFGRSLQRMILLFGLVFMKLLLWACWNGISMPSAQGGELHVDKGGTKMVFSLSTPGWVCFVLSQWGEFEWSMRKGTALVPCTQSQSQNHVLRTRGCVAASSGYLRSPRVEFFIAVYYCMCFVKWCTTSKE